MDLACESRLLAHYLLLGEPDLLRHCIYRSGGQEEEKEDDFQVDFYRHHLFIDLFIVFWFFPPLCFVLSSLCHFWIISECVKMWIIFT